MILLKKSVIFHDILVSFKTKSTGNLTGPSTKALRCLHTSVTKPSEAALERETESQPTNERLSENDDVSPNFLNRNPRNLERMGVARRDKGWGQSHPRRSYWHK